MVDMAVNIGGLQMANPVMPGSGTFGDAVLTNASPFEPRSGRPARRSGGAGGSRPSSRTGG